MPDEDGVEREHEIIYLSDGEAERNKITASDFEKYGWVRNPKDTGWMKPDSK